MENKLPTIDELKERWDSIQEEITNKAISCNRNPEEIQVIAVSKTQPVELISKAMEAGIMTFGENYAQELKEKNDKLPTLTP